MKDAKKIIKNILPGDFKIEAQEKNCNKFMKKLLCVG